MKLSYVLASVVDTSGLPHPHTANTISKALNIVFSISASIALLMIVINGMLYILARGDPNGTARAREGVIYSVVGLVVVMMAYTIVTFVVKGIG